jgi:soluble lytic murein transglycosylase-like protein
MIQEFKNSAVCSVLKTALYFAIAVLPFIIIPFVVVSNSIGAEEASITADAIVNDTNRIRDRLNATPIDPEPESAGAYRAATGLPVKNIFSHSQIGYDAAVLRAVREMGLTLDHFDSWMDLHPETSLARVRFMPVRMQQNVASTALFIRKTNARIDAKTAWREAAAFVYYSAKYGVPSALATAVGKTESAFDPDAVSPKGASGVMQVMWKIHSGLLVANGIHAASSENPLSDPEKAIAAGCLLISRYIKAYGSVQTAMDRYYGGSSASYKRKVNRNIASIINHHAQLIR